MAHEGLWQQLDKLDPQKTAQRAKCQYLTDPPRYVITLLNTEYVVDLYDKQIFSTPLEIPEAKRKQKAKNSLTGSTQSSPPPTPAEFLEQLCILAYLINAQDLPLANKFIKAENLPSGQFFFRGLHSLPTGKLEEAFGKSPESLYEVSERFGAKRCEFGDASVELYVLPRIPLTIVIWRGDEEFDARASILFDQTAGTHLPLDALGALVNLAVEALVRATE
jgi:hypothetical protein